MWPVSPALSGILLRAHHESLSAGMCPAHVYLACLVDGPTSIKVPWNHGKIMESGKSWNHGRIMESWGESWNHTEPWNHGFMKLEQNSETHIMEPLTSCRGLRPGGQEMAKAMQLTTIWASQDREGRLPTARPWPFSSPPAPVSVSPPMPGEGLFRCSPCFGIWPKGQPCEVHLQTGRLCP